METDDLQAQLSHLQQLITDEEQKQHRQKVQLPVHSWQRSVSLTPHRFRH